MNMNGQWIIAVGDALSLRRCQSVIKSERHQFGCEVIMPGKRADQIWGKFTVISPAGAKSKYGRKIKKKRLRKVK